jgi:hypothetical protein
MSAALRLFDKWKTARVSILADSTSTAGCSSPKSLSKRSRRQLHLPDLEPSESPPATSAVSPATFSVLSTVATISVDSLHVFGLACHK